MNTLIYALKVIPWANILCLSLFWGFIAMVIARKKNLKKPGLNFFYGFFLHIIGIIIVIASKSGSDSPAHTAGDSGAASKNDQDKENRSLDTLLKYKELFDKGIITEEEFEAKKKELL